MRLECMHNTYTCVPEKLPVYHGEVIFPDLCLQKAASWRKRLGARLPPPGSRVRASVPPCGFRGGRNGVWVGFSRGFSCFPLPPISFHHFSTLISSVSFHPPLWWCVRRGRPDPCYSRTYNLGASSHLIPRPDLVLDTSWGYLFFYAYRNWYTVAFCEVCL